ncbi:MAG TPA: methyltransferase domain-containing protein [Candidatus Binatia bacterium]
MAEPEPAVRIVDREDYRAARVAFLRRLIDPASARGLEIGAFDLPTVLPEHGACEFADWRSTDELVAMFAVPRETIAPITHVVARGRALSEQITTRYDYVIACHVLEHTPDPIAFLGDAGRLVRPGGIVFLAVPDKRRTADAGRPSTTLDELLERHHAGVTEPPLAQIMQFARAWLPGFDRCSLRELHDFAVRNLASGLADPHCNVWQDEELFAQLEELIANGFLPDLELAACGPNDPAFNEFHVALRRKAA